MNVTVTELYETKKTMFNTKKKILEYNKGNTEVALRLNENVILRLIACSVNL